MPPPPHVGMPSYKMGGSPYQQPQQQQQPMHHPQQQQQPGGQPQQPQYLPNPMYMQHPRPPMGPGGPSPYGPGSYGPQQQPPPPPPQQQQQPGAGGGMPPNNSNTNQSPMPPASPGPNRSMPPHMGPPTPYPGYPPGLCSTHTLLCGSPILTSFVLYCRWSQYEPVRPAATTATKLGTGQYDAWRTAR